jgi:hypothetical protein
MFEVFGTALTDAIRYKIREHIASVKAGITTA